MINQIKSDEYTILNVPVEWTFISTICPLFPCPDPIDPSIK